MNEGHVEVAIAATTAAVGWSGACPRDTRRAGRPFSSGAARSGETGIRGRIWLVGSIDYWFTVTGRRVHKTVHHYLMEAIGGELTIENDPDHEAVDVAWVRLGELPEKLSFLNERRIVELARNLLYG